MAGKGCESLGWNDVASVSEGSSLIRIKTDRNPKQQGLKTVGCAKKRKVHGCPSMFSGNEWADLPPIPGPKVKSDRIARSAPVECSLRTFKGSDRVKIAVPDPSKNPRACESLPTILTRSELLTTEQSECLDRHKVRQDGSQNPSGRASGMLSHGFFPSIRFAPFDRLQSGRNEKRGLTRTAA